MTMADIYEWDTTKPESEMADIRRRVEALEAIVGAKPAVAGAKPTSTAKARAEKIGRGCIAIAGGVSVLILGGFVLLLMWSATFGAIEVAKSKANNEAGKAVEEQLRPQGLRSR